MTKILKLLTISALSATLVAGAFAQASGPTGGGVQNGAQGGAAGKQGKAGKGGNLKAMQRVEVEIWTKLTPPLTADQKAKIEQINQKTKDSYKALKDKLKAGDRAAMQAEAQKIQKERRENVQAILTPEQKKSYMELAKAAMQKMRKGKDGKGKIG